MDSPKPPFWTTVARTHDDFAAPLGRPEMSGEIQKGTGGRGRGRKCRRLSQIVVRFYDECHDDS